MNQPINQFGHHVLDAPAQRSPPITEPSFTIMPIRPPVQLMAKDELAASISGTAKTETANNRFIAKAPYQVEQGDFSTASAKFAIQTE